MNNVVLDVIIVGAGHAGLSASNYLKKYGMNHIVFERGKIGESWRSQRWDSFVLNSPNAINVLPGDYYKANASEGFCSAGEFVATLKAYADKFQLPVKEQTEVISIAKHPGGKTFVIKVAQNGIIKSYQCKQVIICSGSQNKKKIPGFAKNIAAGIMQLHAGEYRNASRLPDGAVLVVGSAQSGCQVAEDLAGNGRKVYLSTSMVARVPRKYRGIDIMDWFIAMKFFNIQTEEITDPAMLHRPAPQLTGTGGGRRTISLQALSKKGVSILGKLENGDDKNVFFQPNAALHVQFADGFSKQVKEMIDEFILRKELVAPAPEEDMADMPDMDARCISSDTSLNLRDHHISSIIWSTGFSADFNYIKLPVFDDDGNPIHRQGLSAVEGLYFLGFPWLRTRGSGIIFGIKDDAEFITEKVHRYSQEKNVNKPLLQEYHF
ncbi:MAG: NAD(P)-binding domain-containing protein [Ferruginibacter sp.]|nr:NAD(P)-binding domain-containing protein [Ferruginibacter sp.]